MDEKKRNITGSYPGSGGSRRPRNANPSGAYPGKKAVRVEAPAQESAPAEKKPAEERPVKTARFRASALLNKETMKLYGKTVAFYSAILIVSVLLAGWICHVGNEVFGLIRPDHEYTVTLEENASTASIAKALQKAGIIDHPQIFRLYCKLKKASGFQYGEYTINCQRDYNQIISALRRSAAEKTAVTFTVREGDTQEDVVVTLCDSLGYLDRAELENVLQTYDFSDYAFLKELPRRNYRLEGYLYPGEYEMYEGESALAVVKRMLDRFEEQVLTEENQKLIAGSAYSLDELVTLAAVLQKESAGSRAKAAGVLYNRLRDSAFPYLQSQATVAYILPETVSKVSANDIRTDDPYNTYRNQGLPPGPICSPGGGALAAVLAPESTDQYYFVCSGGGEMYFAASEAAHLQNIKKAGGDLRGTATVY